MELAGAEGTDRTRVRLAELVPSLSLAIDLGFGQPMEHVLRQCLIALRLAQQLGLADGVLEALGAAYERWHGRGWPGDPAGAP